MGADVVLSVEGYWRLEFEYAEGYEYLPETEGVQCKNEGDVCMFPSGAVFVKSLMSLDWGDPMYCTNLSTGRLVCARTQGNTSARRRYFGTHLWQNFSPWRRAKAGKEGEGYVNEGESLEDSDNYEETGKKAVLLRCFAGGACGAANECLQNRKGPVCGVCAEGYAMTSEGCSAKKCPSQEEMSIWRSVAIACVALLAFFLYVFLSWRHVFPQMDWFLPGLVQVLGLLFTTAGNHDVVDGAVSVATYIFDCVKSLYFPRPLVSNQACACVSDEKTL